MLKRLWESRALYWALGGAVAFLIVFAWIETGSPVFKNCVDQYKTEGSDQDAKQGPTYVLYVFDRECAGVFIQNNEGALGMGATFIIAIFTAMLWGVTAQQAILTKEIVISRRAFVFADGIHVNYFFNTTSGEYEWQLRPIWKNSGETPTRGLTIYTDCEIRNSRLPTGFNFNSTKVPPGTGLLGPQSIAAGGAAPQLPSPPITVQDIRDSQSGKKFIYLWGWARYWDVFPGTPQRITRFCWLIDATGDPMLFSPAPPQNLLFQNIHHEEGNCADEECG